MGIQPYILIGGDSKRFGVDKATFEIGGETLAGRSLRTIESAFPGSPAKFVGRAGGTFLGREVIGDVISDKGAVGAIHTALHYAPTEWVFVIACDLPRVSVEFIRFLADLADGVHGCVVPVQPDGRWQPLCAMYNLAKCLHPFEIALAADGKHSSLRSIIEKLDPRVVEYPEYKYLADSQRLLMNVNTVADLEGIEVESP